MKSIPETLILAVFLVLLLPVPSRAYYSPEQGRWISRDPVGEKGGSSLYGSVANDFVNRHDKLGLMHSFSGIGKRVKYYCKCGWIDEEHLGTGGMYDLINNAMSAYERNRAVNEFILPQSQKGGGGISVKYRLTYNGQLVGKDRLEIACGIFMHAQRAFEDYQGSLIGGGLVTRSSFSVEDLPSDFLGFMIRAGAINDIESVCGKPLTERDSKKMWWYGEGPRQNKSHVPALWDWRGSYRVIVSTPWFWVDYNSRCLSNPCAGKDKTIPAIFSDFKCSFDQSKVTVVDVDRHLPILGF